MTVSVDPSLTRPLPAFAAEWKTPVKPFSSVPCAGDNPSLTGSRAFLPSAVAPQPQPSIIWKPVDRISGRYMPPLPHFCFLTSSQKS